MRYIIIYAVLNPTPKGVGYDFDIHFTYLRPPIYRTRLIIPAMRQQKTPIRFRHRRFSLSRLNQFNSFRLETRTPV